MNRICCQAIGHNLFKCFLKFLLFFIAELNVEVYIYPRLSKNGDSTETAAKEQVCLFAFLFVLNYSN